jgi:hypothetical protein
MLQETGSRSGVSYSSYSPMGRVPRKAGTQPQGITQVCARSYLEKAFSETRWGYKQRQSPRLVP